MSDKFLGYYIINETAAIAEPVKPKFEIIDGRVEFDTNLQDADFTNRNKRYYAREQLFPQLTSTRTLELIRTRNLYGEAGHPTSKDLTVQQTVNPNNRNHLILRLWTDDRMVRGRIRAAATRVGDDFHRSVIDGTTPAFSLRALGSIENTRNGAEVRNLKLITYDFVIFPSHATAYGDTVKIGDQVDTAVQTESSRIFLNESDNGLLIPVTEKSITKFVTEQSKNIKNVVESFELLYDTIELLPNKRQVKIGLGESSMIVSLEESVQNEIMDYCWKK